MSSSTPAPGARLLVIVPHEARGTVHLDKLLPSLERMGFRVLVVGWDRRNELPKRFEEGGVQYQMIFRGWGYANRLLALGLPLWMLRAWWFLLKQRPDLIMAVDFDTGLPTALATLVSRIPFVYNIRDNFAMRPATPVFLRSMITFLDRWIVRRAVRIIVPDEIRITELDESVRRKFVVVDNAAMEVTPPDDINVTRPFTVYAMGYLRESRGIGVLLDAAERLSGIRVLLAGYIVEDKLKARIEASPSADYRGFLPVEEALKLCFESDVIFTYYSPDSEINRRAVSNKWSDAMMASRPILVNSEVMKSAWIEQEKIGYSCPYYDVEQLVALLEWIRIHPEDACQKGANGRRIYDAGYSWSAMEGRVEKLIHDVIRR